MVQNSKILFNSTLLNMKDLNLSQFLELGNISLVLIKLMIYFSFLFYLN